MDPDSWHMEEVVPCKDSEEELPDFCKVFRHEISVNDNRDPVENVTRNYYKHVIHRTIPKAKNVINTIAVSQKASE